MTRPELTAADSADSAETLLQSGKPIEDVTGPDPAPQRPDHHNLDGATIPTNERTAQ